MSCPPKVNQTTSSASVPTQWDRAPERRSSTSGTEAVALVDEAKALGRILLSRRKRVSQTPWPAGGQRSGSWKATRHLRARTRLWERTACLWPATATSEKVVAHLLELDG